MEGQCCGLGQCGGNLTERVEVERKDWIGELESEKRRREGREKRGQVPQKEHRVGVKCGVKEHCPGPHPAQCCHSYLG